MDNEQAIAVIAQQILARRIGEEIIRAAQLEAQVQLVEMQRQAEPSSKQTRKS